MSSNVAEVVQVLMRSCRLCYGNAGVAILAAGVAMVDAGVAMVKFCKVASARGIFLWQ